MPSSDTYKGIIHALSLPLNADLSIDFADLQALATRLSGLQGVVALMTNGHTGDVFSLTVPERAQVTRAVVEAVGERMPVISTVVAEGIAAAVDEGLHRRLPARAA